MVGYLQERLEGSDGVVFEVVLYHWVLDGGVFQVHVCWLKSANRTMSGFSPLLILKVLKPGCIVGTFIGTLEGCVMSVTTYEQKSSLLQISRHIGWHGTVL